MSSPRYIIIAAQYRDARVCSQALAARGVKWSRIYAFTPVSTFGRIRGLTLTREDVVMWIDKGNMPWWFCRDAETAIRVCGVDLDADSLRRFLRTDIS